MATVSNYKTIITAVLILIIALLVFFLFKGNSQEREDEQVAVKCNNKTVFRYKFPDRYFPVFVKEYDNQIAVTTDFLKTLTDSAGAFNIDVGTRNQIVQLQQQLNQDNITFSTGLRSFFMILNNDPCNDNIREKYAMYTEEMSRRMMELRTVVAQMGEIKENAGASASDSLSITASKDTMVTAPAPDVIKHADTAVVNKSINTIRKVILENNSATRRLPVSLIKASRVVPK